MLLFGIEPMYVLSGTGARHVVMTLPLPPPAPLRLLRAGGCWWTCHCSWRTALPCCCCSCRDEASPIRAAQVKGSLQLRCGGGQWRRGPRREFMQLLRDV